MPEPRTKVRTNSKENSTKTVKQEVLTFSKLWANYPEEDPCDKMFTNQCAIRMSQCFFNCGIELKSYPNKKKLCWHHRPKHALLAEDFASWLKRRPFAGCPKYESYTGPSFSDAIDGRTGIIFFKDYWRRGESEASRTGDHIDLWNGSRLTSFTSWFRIQLGISYDGYWSDFERSKSVLFWEIK